MIGAGLHEPTETRDDAAQGTRDKTLTTVVGDVTMKVPKTRTGPFFPALLAPRRRIDVALHPVIMQAYVEGVSTRRVDDLVVAMGGTGVSKSEVSRICAQLDGEVAAWRTRPLDDQQFGGQPSRGQIGVDEQLAAHPTRGQARHRDHRPDLHSGWHRPRPGCWT